MRFITLTTDWGTRDYYVAVAKAQILMQCPDATIIEISHEIKPFDVVEAAFQVSQASKSFPEGTIHIIGIDTEPIINFGDSEGSFPSIAKKDGQYYISNDNGFFGVLMNDSKPELFYRMDDILSNPKAFRFPTKNMLIPIASKIFSGQEIDSFATPYSSYKKAFYSNPIIEKDIIKGHIVHFDSYGNAITNIDRSLFDQIGKGESFSIKFREGNGYIIDHVCTTYNEVSEGEKLAIFGETGLLEIAINRGANKSTGGAQKLFGLRKMDIIRIEFSYRGSHENIIDLL